MWVDWGHARMVVVRACPHFTVFCRCSPPRMYILQKSYAIIIIHCIKKFVPALVRRFVVFVHISSRGPLISVKLSVSFSFFPSLYLCNTARWFLKVAVYTKKSTKVYTQKNQEKKNKKIIIEKNKLLPLVFCFTCNWTPYTSTKRLRNEIALLPFQVKL